VPHFPSESAPHFDRNECPTSIGMSAPLQSESVPHFARNPHNALIEWLRLPGDALFIIGGVLPLLYLCWLGVRHMPQRAVPPEVGPVQVAEIVDR
jgi:hypothetical protein